MKNLEISKELDEKLQNLSDYYGISKEHVIENHIKQSWDELNILIMKEKAEESDQEIMNKKVYGI